MKCPNGHDTIPGANVRGVEAPEGWRYCPECPVRDGDGGVLDYGVFWNPAELQVNGQAQTSEVHQ